MTMNNYDVALVGLGSVLVGFFLSLGIVIVVHAGYLVKKATYGV